MSANGINGSGQNINGLAQASEERRLMCRGVRGATTVTSNNKDEILEATRELLARMVRVNKIEIDDVAIVRDQFQRHGDQLGFVGHGKRHAHIGADIGRGKL